MKSVYKFLREKNSLFLTVFHVSRTVRFLVLGLLASIAIGLSSAAMAADVPVKNGTCRGKFINPITDMCWSCVMPIGISSIFYDGKQDGTKDLDGWEQFVCICDLYIGVPISFYEPARMIDVTTKPYCLVSLGGIELGDTGSFKGDTQGFAGEAYDEEKQEFYQAHFYINPVMYVIGQALDNSKCFEQQGFDVGYITEVDPSWHDPELANLLSPDGFLYGEFAAVFACTTDCAAATSGFGIAEMHWCVGCGGLMYPMTGHIDNNTSTMESAGVIQLRLLNKLHRQGINLSYYGNDGLCGGYRQILMNKRQYKYSMVYPVGQTKSIVKAINQAIKGTSGSTGAAGGVGDDHQGDSGSGDSGTGDTGNDNSSVIKDGADVASIETKKQKQCCQPFGRTTFIWGTGRYYPIKGEDQSYQIYRKRDCCQKVYGYGD